MKHIHRQRQNTHPQIKHTLTEKHKHTLTAFTGTSPGLPSFPDSQLSLSAGTPVRVCVRVCVYECVCVRVCVREGADRRTCVCVCENDLQKVSGVGVCV